MEIYSNIIENTVALMSQSRMYSHIGMMMLCSILMIAVVMIDLWDGVYTAKKCGERVHSHKLRVTVEKLGEYWRIMALGFVTDILGLFFPFYSLPYLSILITLGIILIEIKSVFEHLQRRKSTLTQLPENVERILKCTTREEALELIDLIKNAKK